MPDPQTQTPEKTGTPETDSVSPLQAETEYSETRMEGEVAKAGEKAKVSCLDPDFILIAIFVVLVDGLDIVLEILGVFTVEVPKIITIPMDIITFAIVSGWCYWRSGKIISSKRATQDRIKKQLERLAKKSRVMATQLEKVSKSFAKMAARPAARALLRGGASLIGEIIPLVGIIPFWTITVILMLREK